MHAERACGIIRPRRLFAQPSTPSEHDGSMIVDDKDHPRNARCQDLSGAATVGCVARRGCVRVIHGGFFWWGQRMTTTNALDRGRGAFARRAWADAYSELSAAAHEVPLAPEDLE